MILGPEGKVGVGGGGANKGSLNFQLQSFLTLLQSYPKPDSKSSGALAECNV